VEIARVVLAVSPEIVEETLQYLDRSGRVRVVAAAADDRQLGEAIHQCEPDVVVADPAMVGSDMKVPLLALSTRESVGALRNAVRVRAQGFFVWPGERADLLDAAATVVDGVHVPERRALVVGIHAGRGGAGCTFVATHLAAAFQRRDLGCVLVDADLDYADVTQALGASGDAVRTIADLVPVADELTWSHVEEVRWRGAVLSPHEEVRAQVEPSLVRAVITVAAGSADIVLVHLPRGFTELSRWTAAEADRFLEVVSLDVLSFRASTRALGALEPSGTVDVVVNRAARSEITPGDVRRVFGSDPVAVVPADGAVPRLQDRGRLLSSKGRGARAFDRLATRLVGEASAAGGARSAGRAAATDRET
jgi:septum formation inhibitor-activating ATPase MinD